MSESALSTTADQLLFVFIDGVSSSTEEVCDGVMEHS